ncbi:MAG TPA: sulfotransferase [Rhizomicrobium sp.]|nr:sulfotransferase [Rhizomicrobium sp.]
MSANTQAFFIVSSGRSGTAMLHKALSAADDVEMHHEYMVHIVQPLGVRRYMGLADAAEARRVLAATHAAAAHYSEAAHWGDSSNKLSWLIPELAELLPEARFVHLVRDGRKVAGSYFRKLSAECYDDRSTAVLRAHAADPAHVAAPPPEKKYWWPLPQKRHPQAADFAGYDRFQRICWHWAEINRVILASLGELPPARRHFVRLEELYRSVDAVKGLFRFLDLSCRDGIATMFARPHNVNRPEDRLLDGAQRAQFDAIAHPMMTALGYADRREYVVKY